MSVNLRRIFAQLLVLVMVVSLVGCGQQESATVAPAETDGELSGTVVIWSWDVAAKSLEYSAERFQEIHPNVEFQIEDLGTGQVYDKLTTSLASGAGLPDIVTVEGERIPNFASKFPKGFIDFTGIIDEKDFLPIKVSEVSVDGKLMGVPWDGAPAGIFYRTDLFEEAGINPEDIVTWDDFIEEGKKMNEIGVKMIPVAVSRNDTAFRMIMNQMGGFYFDEDGNTTLNSPESIKAMEIVKAMYDADIIYDNVNWDGLVTSSKEGKVATVANAVWWAGTLQDECGETSGNWGVMPLPLPEADAARTSVNGGSNLMLPAQGGNNAAAIEFAKFAMTDVDSIVNGFDQYGLYPSYIPAFDDPAFNQGVEYFGGQKIWAMFAELGQEIPKLNFTENFGETNDFVVDTQSRILLNGADVQESMDQLQEDMVNKYGQ